MEKAASLNQHVIGYGALAEGEWAALGLDAPDMAKARRYRLTRIRAELAKRDLAGIVVYDPLNVRYATDSTDMQLWCTHNAVRYAFVATDGPVILWDFHNCEHLSWHLDCVDEIRHGTAWHYYEAGEHGPERARRWAAEIADCPEKLRRREFAARDRPHQSRWHRGAQRARHHHPFRRGGDGACAHGEVRGRAESHAPRYRCLRSVDASDGKRA